MGKYPISREFFPFNYLKPPINEKFLGVAAKHMKVPKRFLKAKGFFIEKKQVTSYDGGNVEFYVISPEGLEEKAPCLFYIHGGGFVLKAAGCHYMNCLEYAQKAKCKVIFPDYRLAPKYPFPAFYEDCYAVFCHIYDNAQGYGIDKNNIGIGGDSAGSTLAAGLCLMTEEREHPVKFRFQMLPYPFMDARNNSESCKKFTDTPMWNSTLSDRIQPMTKVARDNPGYVWYSPVEAKDFSVFPPAYIETAEYDCLHDDGILFAKSLAKAGIPVVLNETKGTMHGYDIVRRAKTSRASMKRRIKFMRKYFNRV